MPEFTSLPDFEQHSFHDDVLVLLELDPATSELFVDQSLLIKTHSSVNDNASVIQVVTLPDLVGEQGDDTNAFFVTALDKDDPTDGRPSNDENTHSNIPRPPPVWRPNKRSLASCGGSEVGGGAKQQRTEAEPVQA